MDEIYIVCQSANRSQFIKNKYFKDYKRIKVNQSLQFSNLKYGLNSLSIDGNDMKINIVGSNSFNYYSDMRIIQTILGIIMLLVGIYIYVQLMKSNVLNKIIIPLIVLLAFGTMALYNGITSTCGMSILLKDYLN